ncbi:WD repeat-containing protein 47, partial [Perkinsus chesapeaki]
QPGPAVAPDKQHRHPGCDDHALVLLMLRYLHDRGLYSTMQALEAETRTRLYTAHENPAVVEYFRAVVMAGRWADLLRLVTKLYSSANAADQRAAQFRVYRQEFLELIFLTEEDEKDRKDIDGPLHEGTMVKEMAHLLEKMEPLCSKSEFADLYGMLSTPSLEKYRQQWHGRAGGRYGLWRSYVPQLIGVYGSDGWGEDACDIASPQCCTETDTLDELVTRGLWHKYLSGASANRSYRSPKMTGSVPASPQRLGDLAGDVVCEEACTPNERQPLLSPVEVKRSQPTVLNKPPTPPLPNEVRPTSSDTGEDQRPTSFPKGIRIDIPWESDDRRQRDPAPSSRAESVRSVQGRQASLEAASPEWQWESSGGHNSDNDETVPHRQSGSRVEASSRSMNESKQGAPRLSASSSNSVRSRRATLETADNGSGFRLPTAGSSSTNLASSQKSEPVQEHIQVTQIWQYDDAQAIRCVAFSPCSRYLGIGTNSRSLIVCDADAIDEGDTVELFRREKYHGGSLWVILITFADVCTKILSVRSCSPIWKPQGESLHHKDANSVTISPDAVYVGAGYEDGSVAIWDIRSTSAKPLVHRHSAHGESCR